MLTDCACDVCLDWQFVVSVQVLLNALQMCVIVISITMMMMMKMINIRFAVHLQITERPKSPAAALR